MLLSGGWYGIGLPLPIRRDMFLAHDHVHETRGLFRVSSSSGDTTVFSPVPVLSGLDPFEIGKVTMAWCCSIVHVTKQFELVVNEWGVFFVGEGGGSCYRFIRFALLPGHRLALPSQSVVLHP